MLAVCVVAGVRHFTELVVWKLGDQLRAEVFRLTKARVRSDFKLRSQLDDAVDSVCRNIAEGFGCQSNREFARFLRIARRSLNEVQDELRSAVLKEYVSDDDLVSVRALMRRLYPALASLLRHLDRGRPDGSR